MYVIIYTYLYMYIQIYGNKHTFICMNINEQVNREKKSITCIKKVKSPLIIANVL
jgi:hypothetical protein